MKVVKIGLDLDGTLVNNTTILAKRIAEYWEKYNRNLEGQDLVDIVGDAYLKQPPHVNAIGILRELKTEWEAVGVQIEYVIITHRGSYEVLGEREKTMEWVERYMGNLITKENVMQVGQGSMKLKTLLEMGVSIMVDDSDAVVREIYQSRQITGASPIPIQYMHEYNMGIDGVIHVADWMECKYAISAALAELFRVEEMFNRRFYA